MRPASVYPSESGNVLSTRASRLVIGRNVVLVGTLCGACVALAYTVRANPVLAGASVGALFAVVLGLLVDRTTFTTVVVAIIPWLVLFLDLTPRLTLTVASAVAAVLLLSVVVVWSTVDGLARVGIVLFALCLLVAAIEATTGEQLIEAAKYALFPAMAIVVTSRGRRMALISMRRPLLYSGIAAMGAQGVAIVLHLGQGGTYYGAGEQLGFAAEGPHELALMGVMVALASLITIKDLRWRLLAATIAATPALATGVRSALVALLIAFIALIIRARFRPAVVVSVVVICGAIVVSGVGAIVVARYEKDQAKGEYSNFSTAGSGRGGLWTVTLNQWKASGARGIVLGSGLRSVERIVEQSRGKANTAQSDPITILVEMGLVGLAAWFLIWIAIIKSGASWLVALPLMSYAVTNGSLEYVGAIVFGLALACACGSTGVRLSRVVKPTGAGIAPTV